MTAAETQRVWWAMMLARDVETCCSLLRGEPVDEEALDKAALTGASERGAVVLCRVIDLFDIGRTT
jgi:hypothetical protein